MSLMLAWSSIEQQRRFRGGPTTPRIVEVHEHPPVKLRTHAVPLQQRLDRVYPLLMYLSLRPDAARVHITNDTTSTSAWVAAASQRGEMWDWAGAAVRGMCVSGGGAE